MVGGYRRSSRDMSIITLLGICLVPAVEGASFPGTIASPSHPDPKLPAQNDTDFVVSNHNVKIIHDDPLPGGSDTDDNEDDNESHYDNDREELGASLNNAESNEEQDDEEIEEIDSDIEEIALSEEEVEETRSESIESTVRVKQTHKELPKSRSDNSSSSQPLKTLQKLQQMLDSTDYVTESQHRGEDQVSPNVSVPNPHADPKTWKANENTILETGIPEEYETIETVPPSDESTSALVPTRSVERPQPQSQPKAVVQDKLWTSKDRSKYKKQQQSKRAQEENRQPQLPINPNTSDDDISDGEMEDGLGYTLPNLPVYMTDDEGGTDGTDIEPRVTSQQPYQQPPRTPPEQQQQQQYAYPPPPYPYADQSVPPGLPPPPYAGYPPIPYPYGPYNQQQQQMYTAQQQAWAAATGTTPYGPAPIYPPWSSRPYSQIPDRRQKVNQYRGVKPSSSNLAASENETPVENSVQVATSIPMDVQLQETPNLYDAEAVTTLAEAGSMINFDSIQKIGVFLAGVVLICYCAVSPRTLPLVEYNKRFKDNLSIVAIAMIAPMINFLLVFDTRENDFNAVVNTFYTSFTVGYSVAFILEIIVTTALRLGVFAVWEPDVFKLTPEVPALVLPWVLRENKYRPKRITLFAADFATSCVFGPIVEECVKLKILQLSVELPKNFRWSNRIKNSKKSTGRKKGRVAEPVPRSPGDREVININTYITEMLAASLGMKLCDSIRRILMYTKDSHANKGFYAFCRGIFPIHELCGTMTAIALAKRDVLGVDTPFWQLLAPAVVLHGMANFRGMKPIFKWNSATPWSEMQLSPWNVADDSTFSQLLSKGFAKFMWLVILARVLGYCVKNYYLVNRQAVKRTTTYAGKRAAFSVELAAAEMLKKSAKDRKDKKDKK